VTDEIGIFTPEQARLIWHDYQSRQQLQPHAQKNYPQRRDEYQVDTHRVFVKNTETETIPAYACMRITGVEVVADRTAVTVEKPTDTAGEFLFNGPYPIYPAAPADWETPATTGVGWAFRYGVVIMLGDEPTAAGVAYLPIVGEWEIEEGAGPFIVFGRHDIGETALIGRIGSSGGGADQTVRFRIVAAGGACVNCFAQARVISGPVGIGDPDTLPGSTYDDDAQYYTIDVWDMGEGWLNHPPDELLNMIGHATRLASYEDGPCSEPPSVKWEIISLQCPEEAVCE